MRTAGLGLRAKATWPELTEILARNDITTGVRLALPGHLTDHALIAQLQSIGYPLVFLAVDRLRGVSTLTRSPRILRLYGTGSLAEACALVAAGPDARLTGPRLIGTDRCITLAIAQIGDQP